jgi:hypothetical protein
MEMARKNLEFLKDVKVPGMSKAELDKLIKQVEAEGGKHVGGLNKKKGPEPEGTPPGFDWGSPLAKLNYANYVVTKGAYEQWFMRYMLIDYQQKQTDILTLYSKKRQEEETLHQMNVANHQKAVENSPDHTEDKCTICLREKLRHKMKVNELGDIYFKQWQGLYFPQYGQKMKPTLEAYWKICMLYIRNMRQQSVMKREYEHVRDTFYNYAMQACAGMGVGLAFEYLGTTEAEEEALAAAIAASEEKFEADLRPRTLKDFDVPKDDWVKWIGDHLTGEISLGYPPAPATALVNIGIKFTASSIEFEPYTLGLGAGVKLDWVNNKVETFNSIGPKNKFAISIGGKDLFKVETRMDIIRKTATWDFDKGTYKESYSSSSEVKAVLGSVTTGLKFKVDPSLHSSLESKTTLDAKGNLVGAKGGYKTMLWD